MKDDAIVNNDVSAEIEVAGEQETGAEDTGKPRELLPRDKALAEIARQHETAMGIKHEETPEPEPEPKGEEQESLAAAAAAEPAIERTDAPIDDKALAALGFYRNDSGQIVTKIKVNGEEREMSAEQYRSHMQKDLAGDSKLQSASEIERQLAQRKQQLDQQEERLRTTMTTQKKPSAEDATKLRETIKSAFDKVYDGDLDSATETLMQVLTERGNATTLTSEEIQQQVEQTVLSTTKKQEQARELQAWEQSVDEGNRELAKNHPEIYKDPNLFDLVNSTTSRMLEARDKGDPDYAKLTPKEIIAKAADEVNQWLGNKRGGKEVDTTNSRENRKAGLKPVVRGMDSVTRKPPKKELDMSPLAVVERMAKSRATAINRGA